MTTSILIIETPPDGQERALEPRSHPSPILYLEKQHGKLPKCLLDLGDLSKGGDF